jgi:hypothetical protein
MTKIIEIPGYKTVNAILNKKRKSNLYQIEHSFYGELEEVSMNDLKLCAIKLDTNTTNNNIIKYYEWNNQILTPCFHIKYNANSLFYPEVISQQDRDFLANCKRDKSLNYNLSLNNLYYHRLKGTMTDKNIADLMAENINFLIGKDSSIDIIEEKQIKKMLSDNVSYQQKTIENICSSFKIVDGQLFQSVRGPMFRNNYSYSDSLTGLALYHKEILNLNPQLLKSNFEKISKNYITKEKSGIRFNYMDRDIYGTKLKIIFTVDMVKNLLKNDYENNPKHMNDSNVVFIFDMKPFEIVNNNIKGLLLFNLIFVEQLELFFKENIDHRKKNLNIPNNWLFEKIINTYSFGSEFDKILTQVIDSDYELLYVNKLIHIIKENLNNLTCLSSNYINEYGKVIPLPSDQHIMKSIISKNQNFIDEINSVNNNEYNVISRNNAFHANLDTSMLFENTMATLNI